jgi:hypothetical protein
VSAGRLLVGFKDPSKRKTNSYSSRNELLLLPTDHPKSRHVCAYRATMLFPTIILQTFVSKNPPFHDSTFISYASDVADFES